MEIIFTTLPHKREKDLLKLSVFVSVKLSTPSDTTLNSFPDMLNWPKIMTNTNFAFQFKNGNIIPATLLNENIDISLYTNIFHKDIKVDDFKEEDELTKKNIYSFPAKHVQDFILKNVRTEAVVDPARKVTPEKFVDENNLGAISRYKLQPDSVRMASGKVKMRIKDTPLVVKQVTEDKVLRTEVQSKKFMKFETQMKPKSDFAQVRQFHKVDKLFKETPKLKLEKPSFEFHDIMAAVNAYPQIMRKLGFVLDFTIPYSSPLADKGNVKLVPADLELTGDYQISTPATAYEITDKGFFVADKSSSLFKKGFVKVNTGEFTVIQIDADGAALKTYNMAESKVQEIASFYEAKVELASSAVLRAKEAEEVEPPEEEGLPSMRSAGIAIAKNGMAEHIFKRMEHNIQLKTAFASVEPVQLKIDKAAIGQLKVNETLRVKNPVEILYSDDVVQGYKMDIAYEDEPDKWYSLHQRQDHYVWYDEQNNPHEITGIVPDEGFIQLGLTEDPDNPDEVYISETLARWEGWSLSVRKPGYAINESDDYELKDDETQKRDFVHKSKEIEAKKYSFDSDLDFKINAQSKIVPGTLPKLRFGKRYRIRVRTVDLAGNSVDVGFMVPDKQSSVRSNIKYMRYEPLASPIVLVGNQLKDGEFLESMVIRSNYDQPVSQYEQNHALNGNQLDNYSLRYMLPPKNGQLMAENHGMFEKAFGNNPQAAKEIYKIITDHEGLYQQDEKNKEKIYKSSEVEIIYLPDPMAAGVALFLAEGCENTHTQEFNPRMFSFFSKQEIQPGNTDSVTIPEDWYKAGHIKIRLEEGEMDTKWNASERQLTIFLPKGIRTRIRFSTFWRESDLKELSAIWEMVKSETLLNINEARDLAFTGRHWLVSPSREMELVHAVQQPMEVPVIEELLPNREFNNTHTDINIRFDIHGESTEKVELQSKWKEPLDDGISVTIKEREGSNTITDINLNYHDDVVTRGTIPKPEKLQIAPTQNLQFKPIKRFEPQKKVEFEADPQPGAKKVGKAFQTQNKQYVSLKQDKVRASKTLVNTVKFDVLDYKFTFVKGVNLRMIPLKHKFGDTKHRWVDYRMLAASRYREYFDKILAANPELTSTRTGEWLEKVNIPSSARPKLPEIDYIVPTFEWRNSKNETAMRHKRMGGGIRIFLKRPWYSSGDDEMLGIILPETSGSLTRLMTASKGYSNYYTNWGIDPLLYSVQPKGFSPAPEDFYMNPVIDHDLQYPDENIRAKVVGYPVHFDEERQTWFCDIRINPGNMYFPFIKLVLARYQPYSVRKEKEDVCLSPVVSANFTQLMPDRQTTVQFLKDDSNSKLSVTVEGAIYNDSYAKYGNFNFLKMSFQDAHLVQPLYGTVNDGNTDKDLLDEGVTIKISSRNITNNRYRITREFKLPRKYKKSAFQIIIEEYERGPKRIADIPGKYEKLLVQSEETDRLIYADVFNVNEQDSKSGGKDSLSF